ncbi:hypothetical protein Hgul01_04043 [Herpetosiphon gulosus]|uniref:Uncharacterized protein n=1 Tax=Herpetosiphon gulosus TaxID=1973496 RepID=A0ABP9X497_9CHLR
MIEESIVADIFGMQAKNQVEGVFNLHTAR